MRNNFITLKQQINEVIKSVNFERNTAITRAIVENKIYQILHNHACEGNIYEYSAYCDERNNPCTVVENNDIVANVVWKDVFGKKHYYEVSFQNILKRKYED